MDTTSRSSKNEANEVRTTFKSNGSRERVAKGVTTMRELAHTRHDEERKMI